MNAAMTGRMAIRARQIPPGYAFAAEVAAGELVQIIDVRGQQVADFIAFNSQDQAEFLSTGVTRSANSAIMLQQGMKLFSNRRNPMFELIEDTVGRHDILYACCDARRYADDFGLEDHANCRGALTEALRGYGISHDQIPDPINWFMNVGMKQRGELELREPLSERNDFVTLLALMDTLVAISACPQDQTATNGFNPTDILIRVYRTTSEPESSDQGQSDVMEKTDEVALDAVEA
jgi:uncharacterized protein YcgI (DUF1989 family)